VRPLGFSSPLFALIFVPRILGNPALNLTNFVHILFHSHPALGCEKAKLIFGFARVGLRRMPLTDDLTVPVANGFPGSQNRSVLSIVDRRASPENAGVGLLQLL
jgi:hypothetical protein